MYEIQKVEALRRGLHFGHARYARQIALQLVTYLDKSAQTYSGSADERFWAEEAKALMNLLQREMDFAVAKGDETGVRE